MSQRGGVVLYGLCAVVVVSAAAVWLGAQLAAGLFGDGFFSASTGDVARALRGLIGNPGDPAAAWPPAVQRALPGVGAYWSSTCVVAIALVGLVTAVIRFATRHATGIPMRRRLGVDTAARLARPRELGPIIVARPTPGRLVLGRVGRHLVATEDRTQPLRGRWRMRGAERRRGDRTSVAIVGPTRCGKTANIISGVLDWTGAAVLSSVKTDLMAATIDWRRDLGEVRVFDPTASTGQLTAGWSPLRGATTVTGAQKAARALVDGGPRGGTESLEFFMRLAEQLLWPHLYLAAAGELTIADVVRWMLVQDHPDPERAHTGEVWPLLHAEREQPDPARARAALDVDAALQAIWALDERTRSSTYATAQTLLTAWADPTIAASGDRQEIDLGWLLAGANTLYVCAPLHEQARLAPVLSGLLGDLLNQGYERVSRDNTPLAPTLLVMDEAGNTPARWLPQVASTCAGIGVLLVTIWQSKAQIDAAYGTLSDSVLANHGTKILFSGISDPATLDYAAGLLGDEDVLRRQVSRDLHDATRHSISESTQPVRLVPAHVLRQVRPGQALLIHGTLPPAHLHSRPYFRDPRLRARAHTGAREATRP